MSIINLNKSIMDMEKDVFSKSLDKNGFPEKPPMTFAKLLEELKNGSYVLEQVKDKPVLINGKPIDHISFREGGVDFVSKE